MLVLTRKWGEAIQIGDDVRVTVVKIDKRIVRLGIEAPSSVRITRPEANRKTLKSGTEVPDEAELVVAEQSPPLPQTTSELVVDRPRTILVVDDSPEDRETYRRLINVGAEFGREYQIAEAESGEEGLEWCQSNVPDCVLLDYVLPDLTGLEFLDRLSHLPTQPRVPVVMLSGHGDEWVAVRAIKSGACDYLPKRAISSGRLRSAVLEAIGGQNGHTGSGRGAFPV